MIRTTAAPRSSSAISAADQQAGPEPVDGRHRLGLGREGQQRPAAGGDGRPGDDRLLVGERVGDDALAVLGVLDDRRQLLVGGLADELPVGRREVGAAGGDQDAVAGVEHLEAVDLALDRVQRDVDGGDAAEPAVGHDRRGVGRHRDAVGADVGLLDDRPVGPLRALVPGLALGGVVGPVDLDPALLPPQVRRVAAGLGVRLVVLVGVVVAEAAGREGVVDAVEPLVVQQDAAQLGGRRRRGRRRGRATSAGPASPGSRRTWRRWSRSSGPGGRSARAARGRPRCAARRASARRPAR